MTEQSHYCELSAPDRAYGPAIECCTEDADGFFWAENGEYSSQVNYCPVCGAKAPRQVEDNKT